MIYVEYGPGIAGGLVLATPAPATGLDTIIVIAESPHPIPLIWSQFTDRSQLALVPDGFSGNAFSAPLAVAATKIMFGHSGGRVRIVRFNKATESSTLPTVFAPMPKGMSPADLSAQARARSPLPKGVVPQRDLGSP